MRRTLVVLTSLVAVSLLQSCATSRPLSDADKSILHGVRTVYVEPGQQRYMQWALAKELPQVRLVTNEKDADISVAFHYTAGGHISAGSSNQTYETANDANGSTTTHAVNVPIGEATVSPGHKKGIAIRDGRTMVIYEGFSDAFGNQFARSFADAWRQAN